MHQAGQLWLRQHRTVAETSLEKSGQAGVKGEDLARKQARELCSRVGSTLACHHELW